MLPVVEILGKNCSAHDDHISLKTAPQAIEVNHGVLMVCANHISPGDLKLGWRGGWSLCVPGTEKIYVGAEEAFGHEEGSV